MEKLQEAIADFEKKMHEISKLKATVGFDGFVDSITKVVENGGDNPSYFDSIDSFADHIKSRAEKSCTLELELQTVKLGGNMPIMSSAFSSLGVNTYCVGAMGENEIEPIFQDNLSNNSTIYSFANPGLSTALEFNDGKVMIAQMDGLKTVTWENMKNKLGIDKIRELFFQSDIVAMLNWSEVPYTDTIWRGILSEILLESPPKDKWMIFDLSDCARKNNEDVRSAIELINSFARYYKVVLSLNDNEFNLVKRGMEIETDKTAEALQKMFEASELECLVLHSRSFSMGINKDGIYKAGTNLIEKPELSTGGGDNFNAGFVLALCIGMKLELSLIIANAISSFYVRHGRSPLLDEFCTHIKEWELDLRGRN